jgi:hypothetical protein
MCDKLSVNILAAYTIVLNLAIPKCNIFPLRFLLLFQLIKTSPPKIRK